MLDRTLYNVTYGQSDPFQIFGRIRHAAGPDDITDEKGVVLLHGGVDISPAIYGEKAQAECQVGDDLSFRDENEIAIIRKAWKMGLPIIGICRGAQLLCAVDGGKLAQHIHNHVGRDHTITDLKTGDVYKANSAHHQMMQPSTTTGAEILAIDDYVTSGTDAEGKTYRIKEVPEIVHFPQLRALGIQGHPEWKVGSPYTKYCAQLIERYIL